MFLSRPYFRSYAVTPRTGEEEEEEEEKKEEDEKEEEEILSVVKTRPVNVPVKEEPLTKLGRGSYLCLGNIIKNKLDKDQYYHRSPETLPYIVGLWILLKMSTHHLKQHGVTFVLDFYHL